MGLSIKIKADFSKLDLVGLEGYLKSMIAQATGEPIGRVLYHGIVKTDPEQLRQQLGMKPKY